MDKLLMSTWTFLKKYPQQVNTTFKLGTTKMISPKDVHDLFIDKLNVYSQWAVNNGLLQHRSDLKKLDTIDVSSIFGETPGAADLPGIKFSDGYKEKLENCWYYILPPFKTGVMKVNRHRYVKYRVLEIDEEKQLYWLSLEDYAYDNVWLQDNLVVGEVQVADGSINYRTAGDQLSALIEKDLQEDVAKKLNPVDKAYLTQVAIPYIKTVEVDQDLDDILMHFVGAIVETNIQLAAGKPKAKRGSGNKIQTKAGEVDKNPKPKIVRTLTGGITITSAKPPRPASPDTVRTYHIAAWKSRGHIRHYKDGRTVYVRESIHHRKCLQTDEKVAIPQTIIKVS